MAKTQLTINNRVTKKTPETIQKVLDALYNGITLAEICREPDMPNRVTIYDWEAEDKELALQIARAREIGYDVIAQRARLTARGKTEAQGGESTLDVQRDKLIIETDMKLLSKFSRRFADRQNEDEKKSAVTINLVNFTPEQIEATTTTIEGDYTHG